MTLSFPFTRNVLSADKMKKFWLGEYVMNMNAWIFFTALLCLVLCLIVGISALRSHSVVQRKVFVFLALLSLLGSLSGAISLGRRMTHFSPPASEQAPLPSRSQIISQTDTTRFSLSGKDGTLVWKYTSQSTCETTSIFTVANDILYERGALPQQQEVCIRATRLSTGAELWSTKIKTSLSTDSLKENTLPADKLLVIQGRLYFQINATFYIFATSNGKILHTLPPTLSGDASAILDDFAVNDQALVLFYSPDRGLSHLIVLSPTTLNVLWKDTQRTSLDLIALQGQILYTYGQGMVSRNVTNGSQLWRTALPDSGLLGSSATSERVYLRMQNTSGSADASIYVYQAHDGQFLWKVPVDSWAGATNGGFTAFSPIEVNGVVYIVDTNTLSAYQANTGQVLWRYKQSPLASDSIHVDPYKVIYFSQPVIVGKVVFVAAISTTSYPPPLELFPAFCLGRCIAGKSNIVALNASNGKSYWHYEVPMDTAILTTT